MAGGGGWGWGSVEEDIRYSFSNIETVVDVRRPMLPDLAAGNIVIVNIPWIRPLEVVISCHCKSCTLTQDLDYITTG